MAYEKEHKPAKGVWPGSPLERAVRRPSRRLRTSPSGASGPRKFGEISPRGSAPAKESSRVRLRLPYVASYVDKPAKSAIDQKKLEMS